MQQTRAWQLRRWRRSAAVVVGWLLAAAPALAAPVSAAPKPPPTNWTVESGAINAKVSLFAVTCPSKTFCMAVGEAGNNSLSSKTFAESWDGTTWSTAPSSGPKASWLLGVSCVARDWCEAVGWYANSAHPLTEHWDGHAWSQSPSPSKKKLGPLDGISCTSRKWCIAVGARGTSNAPSFGAPLVERWNGAQWSQVPSPTRNNTFSRLKSVSCLSAKWCMAVGSSTSSNFSSSRTLAELWTGRRWRILPSPNPVSQDDQLVDLFAVDCASPTSCVAVGKAESTGALIESWNGHKWRIAPHPTAKTTYAGFSDVSCASAKACLAVGLGANGVLAEWWNGTKWSTVTLPRGPGKPRGYASVSCPTAKLCKLVGHGSAILTSG